MRDVEVGTQSRMRGNGVSCHGSFYHFQPQMVVEQSLVLFKRVLRVTKTIPPPVPHIPQVVGKCQMACMDRVEGTSKSPVLFEAFLPLL